MFHGGPTLTTVKVDAYNAEVRDGESFIGDRAFCSTNQAGK